MAQILDNNMNRSAENLLLPPEISNEIWSKVEESSAIIQLGSKVPVTGVGREWQILEGELEAEWVDETDEKPISTMEFGTKKMTPYNVAVIIPFSNQFRRDAANLYAEIIRKAPEALSRKFDRTVFGFFDAPGENFDTLKDITEVDVETNGIWNGLVETDMQISNADGILDGWVITPQLKSKLLTAMDNNNRPLFIDSMNTQNNVASLMGHPTYVRKYLHQAGGSGKGETLGYAADWSNLYWGTVGNVSMSIADQATLNIGGQQVNLWQRNMFAARFEVEFACILREPDQFVRLTGKAS